MALFDIFERDGAIFRRPASDLPLPITEVQRGDGKWVPYEGDRLKPVVFGDFLRTVEMGD